MSHKYLLQSYLDLWTAAVVQGFGSRGEQGSRPKIKAGVKETSSG